MNVGGAATTTRRRSVWRECLKVHCVKFGLIYDFYIRKGLLKAYYAVQKYRNNSEFSRYNESNLVFIPIEWKFGY